MKKKLETMKCEPCESCKHDCQHGKSVIKNVKILNINYGIEPTLVISKDYSIVGKIDYQEQKIYVRSDLLKDRLKDAILHEIVHGILEQLGYSNLNDDEQFVTAFTTALLKVMQDNGELFSWLQ